MRDWLDDRFSYLDGEINAGCGTWNVEEVVETPFVEIFPNPAKDRINLRFAEEVEAVVSLYDMTGRLVQSFAVQNQFLVISTQNLSKGIYTLVTFVGGNQQVDRVVVE